MDREVIRRVYSHTCAIGWVPADFEFTVLKDVVNPWIGAGIPFTVVGTGFLVAPDLVLTAGHISLHLRKTLGLAPSQIVAAAVVAQQETAGHMPASMHFVRTRYVFDINGTRLDGVALPSGSPLIDVAVLSLENAIPSAIGLGFANPKSVFVGDPIFVAGYFRGHAMLAMRGTATQRFGPVWLSGHLAAITPMHVQWQVQATDYLLDITAARGVSGAAVCSDAGEVIAIVTGGVESSPLPTAVPDLASTVSLPMNLARALPLLPQTMEGFLQRIRANM